METEGETFSFSENAVTIYKNYNNKKIFKRKKAIIELLKPSKHQVSVITYTFECPQQLCKY